MAVRYMGAHGERGVEQQYALPGPTGQVSVRGHRLAKVIVNLLEDIDERGRHHDAFRHREAQPHGLARLMVRILADDDNLHLIKRREVESIEDKVSGRIARTILILLPHGIGKLLEISRLKLRLEILPPRWFYLYVHNRKRYLVLMK